MKCVGFIHPNVKSSGFMLKGFVLFCPYPTSPTSCNFFEHKKPVFLKCTPIMNRFSPMSPSTVGDTVCQCLKFPTFLNGQTGKYWPWWRCSLLVKTSSQCPQWTPEWEMQPQLGTDRNRIYQGQWFIMLQLRQIGTCFSQKWHSSQFHLKMFQEESLHKKVKLPQTSN